MSVTLRTLGGCVLLGLCLRGSPVAAGADADADLGASAGTAHATTQPEPQTPEEPVTDDEGAEDDGFAHLSLEELMNIDVTSVTGVANPLQSSPAAIHVITAEDIRRSGYKSLPEALRMVPGMQVARIDSNKWAVSARGFHQLYSDKLLVLVDGRTIYTPLFAGVFWDEHQVPLEDIDRIEVIRGPGATIWGANAVNGVINVITKSAKETQGGLLNAGGGSHERGFGTLRYGFELDEKTHLRTYGKYFNRDRSLDPMDEDRPDDWDMGQGGFRLDREGADGYSATVQGDIYGSDRVGKGLNLGIPVPPYTRDATADTRIEGGNLLFRLERELAGDAGWSLQGYYDRAVRSNPYVLDRDQDTFDLEFRHHFALGDRHSLIWGAGYRHSVDKLHNTLVFDLDPSERDLNTVSTFVQDTIELVEDRLNLMIGSKLEHNDFTGFEVQPSIRLSWTPDEKQTIWGAVSRAVRTPSRAEDDFDLTLFYIPFPRVTPFKLLGNSGLDSEKLIAYEVGYRAQVLDNLSVDVATFFNDYDDLIVSVPSRTNPFALEMQNEQYGESYGVEVATTWDVTDSWRLTGSYTWLKL